MNYSILYIAFVSGHFGGVEQKILAQADSLNKLQKDIHLFLLSKFDIDISFENEIKRRPFIKVMLNSVSKRRNPWAHRKEKFDIISGILKEFDPKHTVVYFRFPLADLLFLRFLRKNRKYTFITEHQEIENRIRNGIFRLNFLEDIVDLFYGTNVRKMISGFVGVTPEITHFESSYLKKNKKHFTTIGNGIAINHYPLREPSYSLPINEIRILFIGAGYKPHGLPRLIRSIYKYLIHQKDSLPIFLKIAGDSKEMMKNKKIVNILNLNPYVTFLGNLDRKDLDDLFNWAHVGCGSLAIHKKGLSYTSELKAREYCARGLPFFWSTSDNDFKEDFPYIFQIPKGNGTFNMLPLIEFVCRTATDIIHPLEMRKYAKENLDWNNKMEKLIKFFDYVMVNRIY